MTDNLENQEPIQEQQQPEVNQQEPETQEPEINQEEKSDDNKWAKIDDPVSVQKRINSLYKQVKKSDARNEMYFEMVQKLNDDNEKLKARLNQTDEAEAEKTLLSQLKEARETGDEAKEFKVIQQLVDFKAEQKINAIKKPEPIKKPETINQEDISYVMNYASQIDENGNLLRPWLYEDHPRYNEVVKLATVYSAEYINEYGDVNIEAVLDRVERQMNKPKPQASTRVPDPMKSNLTNKPVGSKIKLSSVELDIAKKLNISPELYHQYKK